MRARVWAPSPGRGGSSRLLVGSAPSEGSDGYRRKKTPQFFAPLLLSLSPCDSGNGGHRHRGSRRVFESRSAADERRTQVEP